MLYVLKTKGVNNSLEYAYFTKEEFPLAKDIAWLRYIRGQRPVLMRYDGDGASVVWSYKKKPS